MTPDELAAHCASLPRCRRKGTAERPAWYVADRLVVRLEDPTTVTIRCTLAHREKLVAAHPGTFGVPPSMERHEKVQAVLDHGDDDAVRDAVTVAYRLQRDRSGA
ncbi:MmcQ/YjbR family DNA-binding protein [Nocardioides sp. 1609]|uniref:MmcQ/YjbR family DNA-binding protein n=1 Tax=Nocardioides sp. 1609 TaxID=2508327 RepID=UPI0010703E8F|nr:MmcQ/YjbR family DNA-binding protein [Nocardioides sp. 1609]